MCRVKYNYPGNFEVYSTFPSRVLQNLLIFFFNLITFENVTLKNQLGIYSHFHRILILIYIHSHVDSFT